MDNALKNSWTMYFNFAYSFVLGFLGVSVALIAFDQTYIYLGSSSASSDILLLCMFAGFFIGCILNHFCQQFFQRHFKILLLFTAFCVSCLLSSFYFEVFETLFAKEIILWIFMFGSVLLLFILFALLLLQMHLEQTMLPAMLAIGVMCGIVVTEFLLLNHLGTAWAIFLNACLLMLMTLALVSNIIEEIITVSSVVAIILLSFAVNVQFNLNSIINIPNDSIAYTKIVNDTKNQYPYIPLVEHILYQDLKIHDQHVLVLGSGIYQFENTANSNVHFTYLNETSNALPSACTYLAIISKGDQILANADKSFINPIETYQTIIANVFPNNKTIPTIFLSYQHLTEIRNALPNNGIAIFNVVANPTLSDLYSKRLDNTVRAVFPNCMKIPLAYSNQPTNIIYVCHKSDEENDNKIYTSNSL